MKTKIGQILVGITIFSMLSITDYLFERTNSITPITNFIVTYALFMLIFLFFRKYKHKVFMNKTVPTYLWVISGLVFIGDSVIFFL